MRRLALTAALLALPGALAAQQKVDIHLRAAPTASIRLGGVLSSVRVIGWDRDSMSLTGTLGAGSTFHGGKMGNPGEPVTGAKYFIEAPDEAAGRANKLELRVPSRARVWIKGGSADIEASGVTGGLDLNIVGGSVRVSGTPRELIVESMDGGVTFDGTAEFARLKTATGDIVLRGGGEDLTLTTISGAIRASNGKIERGRFESVTGPIVFAADIARGGDLKFDSHSGAIELRLVPRADVELDVASVTGTIENAWTRSRPVAGREGRGMEIGISSGLGGARVTVRSFKGNVRLAAR